MTADPSAPLAAAALIFAALTLVAFIADRLVTNRCRRVDCRDCWSAAWRRGGRR